jgi:hypothetical protein
MAETIEFAFSAGLALTGNWHMAILRFPVGFASRRDLLAPSVCGGGAASALAGPSPGCWDIATTPAAKVLAAARMACRLVSPAALSVGGNVVRA